MYNLKHCSEVYLVSGGLRWKVEVYPDLSFSQTFEEDVVKVKTLHDQNAMFDDANVTKAEPANFNFTVLLVKDNDFTLIGDWLTKRNSLTSDEALFSYDIYVDTGVDIFKIEKCVAERATFQIQKEALITVSISGTGRRLTKFGPTGTLIPGTPRTRDTELTPIIPRRVLVELAGNTLHNISSITIELANDVQWIEYDTLHKSLYVTAPTDTSYPEDFVVSGKTLSGTIVQYSTSENSDNGWVIGSLRIRVGDESVYYLDVILTKGIVRNRVTVGDVFTQNMDFRLLESPADLSTILKY